MKDNNKRYWKGIEELSNDPEFVKNAQNEFPEFLPVKELNGPSKSSEDAGPARRDFLKMMGFGIAAASLVACEAPVQKAIPYLVKPEDVEPGIPNWYASTYLNGDEYCSVLVKTREGRPIKIEGNSLSKVTRGGTSARAQASILSLYDTERLKGFMAQGKSSSIEEVDAQIISKLNSIKAKGGAIRLVSSTIMSPSTKRAIADFKSAFPGTEHVTYDAVSASGILNANQASFGKYVIPSYDFSKANIIVSFAADFLGTWISPIEYSKQYITHRKLGKSKKTMNRHYQFESILSLTGSNADYRGPVKPSEEALLVAQLYNKLSGTKVSVPSIKNDLLDQAAADLLKNKGKSLVVSGSNDPNIQILVNEINTLLGNYGVSIDLNTPSYQKQGDDAAMAKFITDIKAGGVAGVIFYNCNPVYNHPMGEDLKQAIKKSELSVSFSDRIDETSAEVQFICPDHHYLESWNDAEPKKGHFSLIQPTISPIFKTRQAQESLLTWAGKKQNFYNYLQDTWKGTMTGIFQSAWDKAVHDGVFENATVSTLTAPVAYNTNISRDLNTISNNLKNYSSSGNGLELKIYEKVGMGCGYHANNPWLQELPDPVSKASWDNYLAVPIKLATEKGLEQGDLVSVSVSGKTVIEKIPVLIQPGQANGSVAVALGYGRTKSGKAGNNVGVNVYKLVSNKGSIVYGASNVTFDKVGGNRIIAQTQTHHTIMARPIIQDAKLEEYQKDASAGRFFPKVNTPDGPKNPEEITLWYEHLKPNHLWGMVIDLNSCIGCGACVVACQVENNIPVVGRDEVINRREMHWLRIDRYYSSDSEPKKTGEYFSGDSIALEDPSENPEVTFQPMLCQHCNHAPCETVCPVAATTHSSEGLNQMAYNRCIGTRYCANNCPYKVRRFNWFKYFDNEKFPDNHAMNSPLGKMVLNPDVTVRSRGVMEKCTFCVQRIQEGKLNAKKEKRRPIDGEIKSACSSACPTDAIIFGDQNDPNSINYDQKHNENKERAYTVLQEINVQPNIHYLTKIRNKKA